MAETERSPALARFEGFELDLRSGELRRNGGEPIRLADQPLRILVVLLEHPHEVVFREEIRKKLWPNDTIVEFEHSISAAMNRLRQALGDSRDDPRYIETLARRGYRWMVPVEWIEPDPQVAPPTTTEQRTGQSLIGKKLSHYRILELLGGGGMGVVYRAEDLRLGRSVAIKFLGEELTDDPRALERFEREARAISALDHPNICTIHEVEEHEGRPFIVMQLLQGQTLRQRIESSAPGRPAFSRRELLDVASQIVAALDAAHQKGIIHRDIKPANIFLTHRREVKLLDFGLAKLTDAGGDPGESVKPPATERQDQAFATDASRLGLTLTGATLGTASYMSPEQVRKEPVDARSDLFSFGAVFYEMATGHQAFCGDRRDAIHDAILNHTPPSPLVWNPNLPAELESVMARALEKDRQKRYQSASEISADLEQLKREESGVEDQATPQSATAADSDSRSSEGHGTKPSHAARYLSSAAWRGALTSQWVVAAAVSLLLLGAIAVIALRLTSRAPLPGVLEVRALTNDGLPKASVATDGLRLYFVEKVAGKWLLTQMSVQGGEVARLDTPFEYPEIYGVSPDRSELLVGANLRGRDRELWIVSIPAGPPHRVGDVLVNAGACWALDGVHILYSRGHNLYLVRRDGTENRSLVTMPGPTGEPGFSPHGEEVRFTMADPVEKTLSLWGMQSDGTQLHHLASEPRSSPKCCGKWSADGANYFYLTWHMNLRLGQDIWALSEGGAFRRSESRRLTSGPLGFDAIAPSIDGKSLFAVGTQSRAELTRYDASSKSFQPFLAGISASDADISRDSQWATYVTYPDLMLWRSRVDDSERMQLTFAPAEAFLPRWSPDGSRIVFTDLARGRIFLVSRNGGVPTPLIPDDSRNEIDPTWMPDGNSIVFSGGVQDPDLAVYQVDLTTRQIRTLPGSKDLTSPRVSPDGLYVSALTRDWTTLMLYDVQTEKWQQLAKADVGGIGYPNWSRDGKWLFYRTTSPARLVLRTRIADLHTETVVDLTNIPEAGPLWIGLDQDDSVLLHRDRSVHEVYALTLQLPK